MKYISDGTWFVEGTEVTLIDDYRPRLNCGLFRGQRRCISPEGEGHALSEVYEDEEVCDFAEFREVPEC